MDGNFIRPVGAMKQGSISVNATTPVVITADGSKFPSKGRVAVEVYVPATSSVDFVYVGNENVSNGVGAVVKKGDSRVFPVRMQGTGAGLLYMVGSSAGNVVVCEYLE